MSAFGKRGTRCDCCGKFTKDPLGQYQRPDGTWGEILSASSYWNIPNATPGQDCCSDCFARWPGGLGLGGWPKMNAANDAAVRSRRNSR